MSSIDDSNKIFEKECLDCKKKFKGKNLKTCKAALSRHKRFAHSAETKKLTCTRCQKQFDASRKDNYLRHIKTCKYTPPEENSFNCLICDIEFKLKHHLTRHEGTTKHRIAAGEIVKLPGVKKKSTNTNKRKRESVLTDLYVDDTPCESHYWDEIEDGVVSMVAQQESR